MGDQPPYGQQPYGQPADAATSASAGAKWGPTSMGMESHIAAGLSYLLHADSAADLLPHREEQPLREVPRGAVHDSGLGSIVWFVVVGVILPIIIGGAGGAADSATGSTGLIGGGASLLSCGLICVSWVGYLGILRTVHLGH